MTALFIMITHRSILHASYRQVIGEEVQKRLINQVFPYPNLLFKVVKERLLTFLRTKITVEKETADRDEAAEYRYKIIKDNENLDIKRIKKISRQI